MSYPTSEPRLSFSERELFDLAIAWITLSVAFALLLNPPVSGRFSIGAFLAMAVLSFVTVGVGFLAHELAHKVVAIHYGQVAEFRADYKMLFLAIMSALVGFLFAAPGAVYHAGRITERENAFVALAGPLTNLGLASFFFLIFYSFMEFYGSPLRTIGHMGVLINFFLAAFNMLPFGPLDGNAVWNWNKAVFAVVFAASALLLAGFVTTYGFF
ncbi:MAG: metalloprotease [Natrialbaceae archaeon]